MPYHKQYTRVSTSTQSSLGFNVSTAMSLTLDEFSKMTAQANEDSASSAMIPAYTMLVLAIIATFGSLTSIVVYARPEMRSPISVLLIGMSLADLCTVWMATIAFAIPFLGYLSQSVQSEYIAYMSVSVYPLTLTAESIGLWILVLLTVERYIAISRPLHARHILTVRKTRNCLIAICIGGFCYNAVRFWEYRIGTEPLNPNVTTAIGVLRDYPVYMGVYQVALYVVTHYIIPGLIILILNTLIAVLVNGSRRARQKMTSQVQTEHSIAFMTIIIVVVFVLCRTLLSVMRIYEIYNPEFYVNPETMFVAYLLMDIGNTLVVLNCAVNWLICLCFNERFRHFFKLLFGMHDGKNFSTMSMHTITRNGPTQFRRLSDEARRNSEVAVNEPLFHTVNDTSAKNDKFAV